MMTKFSSHIFTFTYVLVVRVFRLSSFVKSSFVSYSHFDL